MAKMAMLYYLMKMSKNKKKIDYDEYYNSLKMPKTKTNEDISDKCRICLKQGTISIFGEETSADMYQMLQSIGNIQITETDEYPKKLCEVCHQFMKSAILFKKTAKQADALLRRPVKQEVFNDLQDSHDFSDDGFNDKQDSGTDTKQDKYKIKSERYEKVKITPKITCHVCNKVINRSYYKEHMTMHDPDHKKYVCDICGKSFRLRCAYHNHSLRHRTDFPYKCQFCPYRGRYSELLKTHMRTHTGDYRYMCTECPARFLFKSNLNSHMLKHKEPQFKCDACKRAFHTKLMLQRHFEADHLGIKNHVCNMCGKAFGYRNAMMKHQRHVHKREKMLFGRMPAYLAAEQNKK